MFNGKILILLMKSHDPAPDPHGTKMLDPDPKKIYVDPQHCSHVPFFSTKPSHYEFS